MSSVISASTTSTTALTLSGDTSGQLEIKTGASPTTAVTIDTSQNVGIGTGSPAQRLHISSSGGTYIQVDNSANSITTYFGSSTTAGVAQVAGANPFAFFTNGSERMRITSAGDVGIGATSVPAKLTIQSGGRYNIEIQPDTSLPYIQAYDRTGAVFQDFALLGNNLRFYTASTERMRITSGGNVGIGTSSPAHTLDVQAATSVARFLSTTGTQPAYIYVANTGGDFYFGRDNSAGSTFGAAAYSANIYANGAYPMIFWTNSAERMRITSAGFLCLGTTSKNADGLLSISADSSLYQAITIKDLSAGNNIYYIYFTNSSGGGAGRIEHTGSTTVSYVTSSDARLKTNIVDSGSAQPIIESIKIREFDWVSGEHQRFGVVAQELIDVAPEAVSIGRKEDDSWGVDYSKLVPHLIKYVQELNAKVEAQAAEIQALKGAK